MVFAFFYFLEKVPRGTEVTSEKFSDLHQKLLERTAVTLEKKDRL